LVLAAVTRDHHQQVIARERRVEQPRQVAERRVGRA
jgi:hypothetical protein